MLMRFTACCLRASASLWTASITRFPRFVSLPRPSSETCIDIQVNAYLSFSKGGAFKRHRDIHDVLVVQVYGNKRWCVWNAEVPNPVETASKINVNDESLTPDQEIKMAPGDVLFIPRGEPHSAAVSTKHSVHLTIGLKSQNGINFVDHLREEAAKDPILRMDLPRHSSDEQMNAY